MNGRLKQHLSSANKLMNSDNEDEYEETKDQLNEFE
jgi:hypothetical protein